MFTKLRIILIILSVSGVTANAQKKLTAAVLTDFAPLYHVSKDSTPTGLAIDVLHHVAMKADFKITYLPVSGWDEALEALRSHRADFIPGVGRVTQRENEFYFSRAMESVPVTIFVRKSNNIICGVHDLANHRVSVLTSSAAASKLAELSNKIQLVQFPHLEGALFALIAGDVDALVAPEPVVYKKLHEANLSGRVKVTGEPVLDLTRGYLFRKEDSAFVKSTINPVLEQFTATREYLDIFHFWYGKPVEYWTAPRVFKVIAIVLFAAANFFGLFWIVTVRKINRKLKTSLDERETIRVALSDSEARYRNLFNGSPFGIVVASLEDGKIFDVNRTFLSIFGYTREQALTMHAADFHPQSAAQEIRQVFMKASLSAPDSQVVNTHPCLNAAGTEFFCQVNAVRITIKGAEYLAGFFMDITEKLRQQEQERQSQKLVAIGQLAGGMAHDFNNQLAGILGYADLIAESTPDPTIKQFAESIASAAHHSTELTSKLLAFARKGKYVTRQVDVHAIIHEVEALLKHTLNKNIIIECSLHPNPVFVKGDPGQLQNAILNLALNARDAMPQGGMLKFVTTVIPDGTPDRNKSVRIQVIDTGCGIRAAIRDRIFDPFFTTKDPGKGTGMGLAAVFGTVTNHNGTVTVDSKEGAGATFTITIPFADRDVAMEKEDAPVSLQKPESISIMIVDDETIVREILAAILRGEGHSVNDFDNGEDACNYFKSNFSQIDLVILDMIMPGMNGSEVFVVLRQVSPSVKVILSSGYSLDTDAQQLLKNSEVEFIQKPYRKKDLIQLINHMMNRELVTTANGK